MPTDPNNPADAILIKLVLIVLAFLLIPVLMRVYFLWLDLIFNFGR